MPKFQNHTLASKVFFKLQISSLIQISTDDKLVEESLYQQRPFLEPELVAEDQEMQIETIEGQQVSLVADYERDELPEIARHEDSLSNDQYMINIQSKFKQEDEFGNLEGHESVEMQAQMSVTNNSENEVNFASKIFDNNFDFWGTLEPENWKPSTVNRKEIVAKEIFERRRAQTGSEKTGG